MITIRPKKLLNIDANAKTVKGQKQGYMTASTLRSQAAYIKDAGKCPCCNSDQIEGGPVQIDGPSAWQSISCNDCGARWADIYTLSSYEIEEYPHD